MAGSPKKTYRIQNRHSKAQTNRNKQTRLTDIDQEIKQIEISASSKTKKQTKQTIFTNMSKSFVGLERPASRHRPYGRSSPKRRKPTFRQQMGRPTKGPRSSRRPRRPRRPTRRPGTSSRQEPNNLKSGDQDISQTHTPGEVSSRRCRKPTHTRAPFICVLK